MATQFTPCPACGAVGEVGSNCQFCGTTILLKVGVIPSTSRLVPIRNISEQEYVEKISKYQKVSSCKNSSKLMYANIGDEIGLINLNAEIVHPLQHEYSIHVLSDNILYLENKNNENIIFTKNGKKIQLGKFLNLETMEKNDGIEKSGDYYYSWESLQCKGEIDPINWTIMSPPLLDRKNLAMSYLEYEAFKKQKESDKISKLRAEIEEEKKREDALIESIINTAKKVGLFAIIIGVLYLLYSIF